MATPEGLRVLLAGAIDYAGLFPPASLPLSETVARYAAYRRSPQSWALGKLVVPAARLPELEAGTAGIDVAVLLGNDVLRDLQHVRAHLAAASAARVAALEGTVSGPAEVASFAEAVAEIARAVGAAVYVELPLDADLPEGLDCVREHGLRAKARTGGVTEAGIPPSRRLLPFLHGCVARGLTFKLTAGLHHVVRGVHPLTYDAASPRATMHGFLNVLAATVFLADSLEPEAALGILDEEEPEAFGFDDRGIRWRDRRAGLDAVHRGRQALAAFGSCSFEEPVQEMRALGLA